MTLNQKLPSTMWRKPGDMPCMITGLRRVRPRGNTPMGQFVPTTSCMYSIDLRYHWLLNDEKWWAEEFHWS